MNRIGDYGQMGGSETAAIFLDYVGIDHWSLHSVEMEPEKFPGILLRADMAVGLMAVQQKTVLSGNIIRNIFIKNSAASRQDDEIEIGIKARAFSEMGLQTFEIASLLNI